MSARVSGISANRLSSQQRSRIVTVFLFTVIAAAAVVLKLDVARSSAAVFSNTAVSQTMHAFVHEDASIGLSFDDGSAVGNQSRTPLTVPPGTYTVRVVDDTSEHNFHLTGPGLDQSTDIGGSSSPTWTITIQAGATYNFQCDNHPDFMYGQFVGAGASSGGSTSGGSTSGGSTSGGSTSGGSTSGGSTSGGTTSSGGSTSTSVLTTLAGTVSATGKLTLKRSGKTVSKLKPGRYTFSVTDSSKTTGFLVQQLHKTAKTITTAAYTGKKTVTLNLTAGQWFFYTSAASKTKSTFTVAT